MTISDTQLNTNFRKHTYNITLIILIVLAAFLRFWHLGELDFPVFDEVYFPNYGYSYLAGIEFFHAHPPLYNYLSAAAIWLYYHMPWLDLPAPGSLGFTDLEVLSYRWINALAGTFLVWVVARVTQKLTRHQILSLLITLFIAIDGTFVVDSRFGMNNLFLVLFGLLALLCLVNAFQKSQRKVFWLIMAGIWLGCSVSVKWNGLGFTAFCLVMFIVFFIVRVALRRNWLINADSSVLVTVRQFSIFDAVFYLVLVSTIIYSLLWIPDRLFNTEYNFIGIHEQILGFHSNEVSRNDHPYCSRAYQWPVMFKPINYYFNIRTENTAEGEIQIVQDIHLFGNPALHWLSTLAITVMAFHWLFQIYKAIRLRGIKAETLVCSGILAGYFANLLPWLFVSRCVFLYHYQSAAVFGFMALAWYMAAMLRSKNRLWISAACVCLIVILAAFVYWLPFSLGLELSPEAFYQRMWMDSWV